MPKSADLASCRHAANNYTPDWLAERMVAVVVQDPLHQRVLDPACGSGTFLFHAVRRYLDAAQANGSNLAEAIHGATAHVIGVDVHPLAVTFARVTYLLAIGRDRIRAPARGSLGVPVYLGDSMQWGQQTNLFTADALTITTGSDGGLFADELRFPNSLIGDANRFDRLVVELADKAAARRRSMAPPSLNAVFRRYEIVVEDQPILAQTFRIMCELHDQGRNHIWGYYVRNLARPVWLSQPVNRVDVLIGNPPWLTYNAMVPAMKTAFREASEERGLWSQERTARNHDLSGLFVARCIQLYLRDQGRFGFVMPLAVLSRRQFAGFRTGRYGARSEPAAVTFTVPWDLDKVRPHPFPVPSSVVFGTRTDNRATAVGALPSTTERMSGSLPSRNVGWDVAKAMLTVGQASVAVAEGAHASEYSRRFESGAKLNPQVLVLVTVREPGPLGVPSGFLRVASLRTNLEHEPWRSVPSLDGVIEVRFIRRFHQGSTITPYRSLEPVHAVVPWDEQEGRLLDVGDERLDTFPGLARWWTQASEIWNRLGTPSLYTLTKRVDFQRKLTRQFPIQLNRVVYTASGSHLAAARITDLDAVFSEKLYWATVNADEALYLTAILNSDTLTALVAPYQSRGQFGTRDFHKYVFYVPIPIFDPASAFHQELTQLAKRSEQVAASVSLPAEVNFHMARRRVREALVADGVANEVETRVQQLLR